MYLLHKEGYYALDTSPLALLWKDAACSQYFIDTDAQGVATQNQVSVQLSAAAPSICQMAMLLIRVKWRCY